MQIQPESPDYEAAIAVISPALQELLSEFAGEAASFRQEMEAAAPETLWTQLRDTAGELLELVEVLADRPLNARQLALLGKLEVTANNAKLQAEDFCAAFEG